MKTITIQRSKWARKHHRGHSYMGPSLLRNNQGNFCCLGFICKSEGIDESDLVSMGTPAVLLYSGCGNQIPSYLLNGIDNSELATSAITINDDPTTTDAYKEEKLKELFARHLILEFED